MAEYIEREALIECAEHTTEFRQHMASVYDLESLVAGMQSADVAPVRHGRWLRYGRNLGECSNCGEIVNIRYNYCPNCGARMDGERKENENV